MQRRVSTGISKLDMMIGGGFIEGETYLVTGETGVGKTILGLQYLLDGLLKGETCVYVSLDERIENVVNGVRSLGWDLWPYVMSKIFYPVEARLDSAQLQKHGKESRSFLNLIPQAARGRTISRIVLDPISAVAQGVKEEFYVREYLREVIRLMEGYRATILLTCDIPSGSLGLSRYGFEEFLASGIIVLKLTRSDGSQKRTVYVRKMRWSPMDAREYTFDIESGPGIVIGEAVET